MVLTRRIDSLHISSGLPKACGDQRWRKRRKSLVLSPNRPHGPQSPNTAPQNWHWGPVDTARDVALQSVASCFTSNVFSLTIIFWMNTGSSRLGGQIILESCPTEKLTNACGAEVVQLTVTLWSTSCGGWLCEAGGWGRRGGGWLACVATTHTVWLNCDQAALRIVGDNNQNVRMTDYPSDCSDDQVRLLWGQSFGGRYQQGGWPKVYLVSVHALWLSKL